MAGSGPRPNDKCCRPGLGLHLAYLCRCRCEILISYLMKKLLHGSVGSQAGTEDGTDASTHWYDGGAVHGSQWCVVQV